MNRMGGLSTHLFFDWVGFFMRVVIIGQRVFGRAVLEAFLSRGDEIAAVFVAPEKENARPDALKTRTLERKIPLYQFENLSSKVALETMESLKADIAVMAYVVQFVPQEFARIPVHGTIQFHPSLLPRYRGPSAVNWAIVCDERETGVTIFRPTDEMDEGPVILQKTVPIHPDDTAGTLYYERLFPVGVQALLEAADCVVSGNYEERAQDIHAGSYESWLKESDAHINWGNHVNQVYNLIRGCDPTPGAWVSVNGEKIVILECRKVLHHSFQEVRGKVGTIVGVDENSFSVGVQGGEIRILVIRMPSGEKMRAADFMREKSLIVGMKLGS